MEGPVAKIIMLAATIAITAGVVFFTWTAVGENTPTDLTPDDVSVIKNQALCTAAGGTWNSTAKTCAP